MTHVTLFAHPCHFLTCHCCVTGFCCHIERQPCWFLQSPSHPADTGLTGSDGRLIFQLFFLNVFQLFLLNFPQFFLRLQSLSQLTQEWRAHKVVFFCKQFAFTLNVTQVKCQHQNFRPQIEAEFLIIFFFMYLFQLQIYPRDFVDICCCTRFLPGDLNIG